MGSVTESAGAPQRTGREAGGRSAITGTPGVCPSCQQACPHGADRTYYRQDGFARSAGTVTDPTGSWRRARFTWNKARDLAFWNRPPLPSPQGARSYCELRWPDVGSTK
jgi:hypothetical protein